MGNILPTVCVTLKVWWSEIWDSVFLNWTTRLVRSKRGKIEGLLDPWIYVSIEHTKNVCFHDELEIQTSMSFLTCPGWCLSCRGQIQEEPMISFRFWINVRSRRVIAGSLLQEHCAQPVGSFQSPSDLRRNKGHSLQNWNLRLKPSKWETLLVTQTSRIMVMVMKIKYFTSSLIFIENWILSHISKAYPTTFGAPDQEDLIWRDVIPLKTWRTWDPQILRLRIRQARWWLRKCVRSGSTMYQADTHMAWYLHASCIQRDT